MQISGSIVQGNNFSSKIDFPTINIKLSEPNDSVGLFLGDSVYGESICFLTACGNYAEVHIIKKDIDNYVIKPNDILTIRNMRKINDTGTGLIHTYYLGCHYYKMKKYYMLVIVVLSLFILYLVRKK